MLKKMIAALMTMGTLSGCMESDPGSRKVTGAIVGQPVKNQSAPTPNWNHPGLVPTNDENRRQGPIWALGFQLSTGYAPLPNTGGCRMRLDPGGVLSPRAYFVWNTYTNADVMRAKMEPDQYGLNVPFDLQGGTQIALSQSEWQQLARRGSILVTFWTPVPFGGHLLEYHSQQKIWLGMPPNTGNLLAGRISVPWDCYPRGYYPGGRTKGTRHWYRYSSTVYPFQ